MPASVETREAVTNIIDIMMPILDERQKRILLAASSMSLGHGGVTVISEHTGASRSTITNGINEINDESYSDSDVFETKRVRRQGAGRKSAENSHPSLYDHIEEIIKSSVYGSPMKVIRWTTLSLEKIAKELKERFGITVSRNIVARGLDVLGYSRQQNQKNLQIGKSHPDRNAQFVFIDRKASEFIEAGDPVISVDTKKKELIGNFKNNGSEYRKKKQPRDVLDHDFAIPELGKVAPYGVYVLNDNTGFINLGTDHDTSEFAAESILRWWGCIGKNTFPKAKRIYINADSGGSNGVRVKQWKYELQQFANYTGLEVHVSHYPSGTSKWNKIEHRLFCYISKNWQGKPLINIETVVNLISSTTTSTGLKVICQVDTNHYELRKKPSEEQMKSINMQECDIHGWWNYIIRPNN